MVGHYNPHTNTVALDAERITYWIRKGAQVSDTLHNILVSQKVIKGEKKNVLPRKTPIAKEEVLNESQKEETDEHEKSNTEKGEAQTDKKEEKEPVKEAAAE